MSDSGKKNPASTQEQQYLRRSLRRIIVGQEIGPPRTPRWRAAWKRTLLSYADRLEQLSAKSRKGDQAT